MRIIFLDIDGVLNCQVFYDRVGFTGEERERNICSERIGLLNDLCRHTDAKVVISSTWRLGKTVEELQSLLYQAGGTFEVVDKTPNLRGDYCLRGNEIYKWIKDNQLLLNDHDRNYKNYAIIDDDSDMLLWQAQNFFQVDSYGGLTPNVCYRIKRFFNVDPYKK